MPQGCRPVSANLKTVILLPRHAVGAKRPADLSHKKVYSAKPKDLGDACWQSCEELCSEVVTFIFAAGKLRTASANKRSRGPSTSRYKRFFMRQICEALRSG